MASGDRFQWGRAMSDIKNFSHEIARIQVNLVVLAETDSQGDWQHDPLVRTYKSSSYNLNDDQLIELDLFLTECLQNLKTQKRYEQLKIF